VYYKNNVVLKGDRKCQSILLTKWTLKYQEQYCFCEKICEDTPQKNWGDDIYDAFFYFKKSPKFWFLN